jgi:hypothetical protein
MPTVPDEERLRELVTLAERTVERCRGESEMYMPLSNLATQNAYVARNFTDIAAALRAVIGVRALCDELDGPIYHDDKMLGWQAAKRLRAILSAPDAREGGNDEGR